MAAHPRPHPAMGSRLASHLSFCMVEDQVIFLDRENDRYFRLDGSAAAAFAELVGREAGDPEDRLHAGLVASGILETGNFDEPPRPADVPACDRSSVPRVAPRAGRLAVLAAFARQIRADRAVRKLPLTTIIARLGQLAGHVSRAGTSADSIVAAHRQADLWYSPHDRCLAKSIALLAHLRGHGHAAQLVFGVAIRPFAAHCWVQSEGAVLNSDLEEIRMFKPIFAV